jgi:predicted DNA-binding transcriptional regulator YafY
MAKKKKRVARLIEMVLLIQARPDWRPGKLAKHFGISETRIYQDIKELVAAGVPIYFARGGYRIAGDFVLRSAELTPDEILDLLYPDYLFAGESAARPSQTLLEAKMALCMPRSLDARSGLAKGRVRVTSSTPKGPQFRRLHDAVSERRRIKIRYASRSSSKTTEREVDPYALVFRKHSWYLIAKCHTRQSVRKFSVSRILSVVLTKLRFPEPRDFSLQEYTEGWWEVFGGDTVDVAVRFNRRIADLIRDRLPRPGQSIQELHGGDVIYRVSVRGIQEISWWIMQYGPDAEVLEPAALRDLIADNAARVLKVYRGGAQRTRRALKVAEEPAGYQADGQ